MGRIAGETPWHAAALRLQADGRTAAQIVEILKDLPKPPKLDAVKKFLARSKKDPGKALQVLASSNQVETPALPPLSDEDGQTLVQLFVAVEKDRARVLKKLLKTIEEVSETDARQIDEALYKKGAFALRAIEALKSSGSILDVDPKPPAGDGPGGAQPKNIQGEVVRGRLAEMAAEQA